MYTCCSFKINYWQWMFGINSQFGLCSNYLCNFIILTSSRVNFAVRAPSSLHIVSITWVTRGIHFKGNIRGPVKLCWAIGNWYFTTYFSQRRYVKNGLFWTFACEVNALANCTTTVVHVPVFIFICTLSHCFQNISEINPKKKHIITHKIGLFNGKTELAVV